MKVLYDTGAGTFPNLIADNVPVANGTTGIAWNPIPDNIGNAVKIRVIDKGNLTTETQRRGEISVEGYRSP